MDGRKKGRERPGMVSKMRKCVNGTQISIQNVSTGKTRPPFQKSRLFRKFSSGTGKKRCVPFTSQPEFRKVTVNGKQPE